MNAIFDALVFSKLRYAICVWSGFLSAELAGQINAFLKRAFKYAFCAKIYTIGAIAEEADKLLFKKVMSANHCIHFLLPTVKSSGYCLEPKDIHMSSPDVNKDYIKSLLFHDVCIEIVTVKQSALSLWAF